MILKGFDRSTMLKCRLINSDWKAAVDSLQEKKVLSNWLTWNATDPLDKDLFQIMPTVQVDNGGASWGTNFVYLCAAIKEAAFEDGYNPFPSKSLCIALREPTGYLSSRWYNDLDNFLGLERVEMHLFLIDHGHHLTSLALYKTRLTPDQMLQIINHVPNLKALTLIWIVVGSHSAPLRSKFFRENPIVNALPMLTHLRVQSHYYDDGLIHWLIDG